MQLFIEFVHLALIAVLNDNKKLVTVISAYKTVVGAYPFDDR